MAVPFFTLTIVFLFFAWIISFYYRRERKIAKPGWRPWVLALAPLLLFGLVFEYAIPRYRDSRVNRLPSPWQGVPVKEYEDPAAATHAILSGKARQSLEESPIEQVVVTNTVPIPLENWLVLLPHVGSATRETRQAMGDLCKANLDAWFAGKPLPTLIPELA